MASGEAQPRVGIYACASPPSPYSLPDTLTLLSTRHPHPTLYPTPPSYSQPYALTLLSTRHPDPTLNPTPLPCSQPYTLTLLSTLHPRPLSISLAPSLARALTDAPPPLICPLQLIRKSPELRVNRPEWTKTLLSAFSQRIAVAPMSPPPPAPDPETQICPLCEALGVRADSVAAQPCLNFLVRPWGFQTCLAPTSFIDFLEKVDFSCRVPVHLHRPFSRTSRKFTFDCWWAGGVCDRTHD